MALAMGGFVIAATEQDYLPLSMPSTARSPLVHRRRLRSVSVLLSVPGWATAPPRSHMQG
jgi:hypothetical protein